MYYGLPLGSIHLLLHEFIPYWNFENTQDVALYTVLKWEVVKTNKGPATQVTHLRLNQPSSFCSELNCNYRGTTVLGLYCKAQSCPYHV